MARLTLKSTRDIITVETIKNKINKPFSSLGNDFFLQIRKNEDMGASNIAYQQIWPIKFKVSIILFFTALNLRLLRHLYTSCDKGAATSTTFLPFFC